MKTAVLIQARLGSTRLPGKMLLPFNNDTGIFEILLQKLRQLKNIPVYLVTSYQKENDQLEVLAKAYGVEVFRGSENNVLERFIKATDAFEIDRVVRVCADNPFLNISQLLALVELADQKENIDYCSFSIGGKPVILHHVGLFCEVVSKRALKKVAELTSDALYLEHVTNYIYTHPETFEVCLEELGEDYLQLQHIRLTVDTINDFNLTAQIYKEVDETTREDALTLLKFIDQKKEWTSVMKNEIAENTK